MDTEPSQLKPPGSIESWGYTRLLLAVMAPFVAVVINLTAFNVALPAIRGHFELTAAATAWLVTAYALPYVLVMPFYGSLADRFSPRLVLISGLGIFTIGTVAALVASQLPLLVAGRVVQALGAAVVHPLALSVIARSVPTERRGAAMGTWNASGPAASIIGPLLAGFLAERSGWRSIFVMTVVSAGAALVAIWFFLPRLSRSRPTSVSQPRFDLAGSLLFACGLCCLVFFVSSEPITGVPALQDWRLALAAVASAAAFVLVERRQQHPLVPLELLRNRTFRFASLIAALRMVLMTGVSLLIPLCLVEVFELPPTAVGAVVMGQALSLLVTIRVGGAVADRTRGPLPVVVGIGGQALCMTALGLAVGNHAQALVVVLTVVHGALGGFSLAALHRLALGGIQKSPGTAAGLYSTIRFMGTTLGGAIIGAGLDFGLDRMTVPATAYRAVFLLLAVVAVLTATVAASMGRKLR